MLHKLSWRQFVAIQKCKILNKQLCLVLCLDKESSGAPARDSTHAESSGPHGGIEFTILSVP